MPEISRYPVFTPQIHRVTRFEIVGDYIIHLTFADKTEQVIDFEPILTGLIFGPLKDRDLFNQVILDKNFGTLEWPNGADIDPAILHDWPEHVEVIIERRKQNFATV